MKRCIVTHSHTSFGEIPAGSLWADDSPFLSDETAGYFEAVDEEPPPVPKRKPVRKFGEKKVD